jgi:hypothetical protein
MQASPQPCVSDVKKEGLGATVSERMMWGAINMNRSYILNV